MFVNDLLPMHGGFRKLRNFQCVQVIYDGTVIFCDRYIDKKSRTHDQRVQAARGGVRNIAEVSLASATSKKIELKLTGVARASFGEWRQLKSPGTRILAQRRLYCAHVPCAQ